MVHLLSRSASASSAGGAGDEAFPGAPGGRRVLALDLARALAFAGMLLAHLVVPDPGEGPAWLRRLDAAADGRAAPLFCVLLGVGAGLLAGRGGRDGVLVRRGLLLFALGIWLCTYTESVFVILPVYGVLLALVALLRRLPTAWLLPAAGAAFLVPSVVTALDGPHQLRARAGPTSWSDVADVGTTAWDLLWAGPYPMVGWVGFVLVGVWLSRLSLSSSGVLGGLAVAGAVVASSQVALGQLAERADLRVGRGWGVLLDASAHSNHTAWYVLSTASAVAAIGVLGLVARRWGRPLDAGLAPLGQMALSAYVAHIVVGERWAWDWQSRTDPSLVVQVLVVLALFAALAVAARLWRARFGRGPLEGALRALSGW